MKKGLLIILSGPSGVGKGTIRKKVMENTDLNLAYSISMTTRLPRKGEINGVDYFFVTKDEFENNVSKGKLLEYAKFCENYYGTPLDYVESLRNDGKNVILEIETRGARQVMAKCISKDEISVFLAPPSIEELERRIRGRNTESEDIIQERLAKARHEMIHKDLYDYIVVNNTPEEACNEIIKIIKDHLN